MSLIDIIAGAIRDTMYGDEFRHAEGDWRRACAINILRAMRDAPKSVLWAGALHADADKDLAIWSAMIDEALRE